MQAKITKRVVDTATAVRDNQLWVWDVELEGFGLRVRPNGRKTYVLEYRPGRRGRSTQKRRVTIGTHGSPLDAGPARKEALRLLALIASGNDPAADKAAGEDAPQRFDELVERFLREHIVAKRKPSTAKEYRRLLKKFVTPAIGRKRVADVNRPDILNPQWDGSNTIPSQPSAGGRPFTLQLRHRGWRSSSTHQPHRRHRAVPGEGARTHPICPRARLAWRGPGRRRAASGGSIRLRGKVRDARRCFAAARAVNDRMAGGKARRELAQLRASRPAAAVPPQAIFCFRLLFFTGARCGEIQTLQRAWMDFERAEARLPNSKTGVKTVHIPPPALDLLANAPRIAGNPYVITGEREGAHFVGLFKCWQQIRNAATVKDVGRRRRTPPSPPRSPTALLGRLIDPGLRGVPQGGRSEAGRVACRPVKSSAPRPCGTPSPV